MCYRGVLRVEHLIVRGKSSHSSAGEPDPILNILILETHQGTRQCSLVHKVQLRL